MKRYLLYTSFVALLINPYVVFADDIKDVKDPINFPPNLYLIYALLILIVLFLIFSLTKMFLKRNKREKEIVIQKTAWEIAYESLSELDAKKLPQKGSIQEYYIILSDIVRHYIEDRFAINAPEMTTEEFLFNIKTANILTKEQQTFLEQFLDISDMVKFAKGQSNLNEMNRSFSLAKQLVDDTKEDVVEESDVESNDKEEKPLITIDS